MRPKQPRERSLGELGVTERLRRFVAEMPYERRPILDFVMEVAADTGPGSDVLDVGAGDAPYRELFAHTSYRTNDWAHSVHDGSRTADIVGSALELPVSPASFDLVLCTQVLEHVADPAMVLAECARVLRPDGVLAVTVPLVWQLHEQPHDYFRYTSAGLEHLMESVGFSAIEIHPRNDCFTTLAQLMLNVGATLGRASDGLDSRREAAASLLSDLAAQIAPLAPLDVEMVLPLGYAARAVRK
jgi:SAM-dependent methyltransferase